MTEWELQDQLTLQWIKTPLQFHGTSFYLVAWELMFPSWEINSKNKKWNEVSVDFILFDGAETFLTLELKYLISGRKNLLSAYCQTLHRSALFASQYSPEKMQAVHTHCFDMTLSYRVQELTTQPPKFHFPKKPKILPVLAARQFPALSDNHIQLWNAMSWPEFEAEIGRYVLGKEMKRMVEMGSKDLKIDLISI